MACLALLPTVAGAQGWDITQHVPAPTPVGLYARPVAIPGVPEPGGGQGGPFTAQIENFWRLISTGGRTFQTMSATKIAMGSGVPTTNLPIFKRFTINGQLQEQLFNDSTGTSAYAEYHIKANDIGVYFGAEGSTSGDAYGKGRGYLIAGNSGIDLAVANAGSFRFHTSAALSNQYGAAQERLRIDTNITAFNNAQYIGVAGSVSAPAFSIGSATNGLYASAAGFLSYTGNGTLPQFLVGGQVFRVRSDLTHCWASTTNPDAVACDTGISRTAPGVITLGNGSQGDSSATVKAATWVSGGSGLAVNNVGANSCGTTAATIAGGNNAFVITVGATSGTQCRVTFTVTATTEWDCSMTGQGATLVAPKATPVDTTHTDFFGTFGAGDTFTAVCFPR